jgi:hypothetical protein
MKNSSEPLTFLNTVVLRHVRLGQIGLQFFGVRLFSVNLISNVSTRSTEPNIMAELPEPATPSFASAFPTPSAAGAL